MTDAFAQLLVDCCPVGLSLHEPHGEFRAASEECARVFGRERDALLQRPLAHLVDPRDRERVQAEWAAAALRGRDTTLRYRLQGPTGAPTWIETDVRVSPPRAAELAGAVACASRIVRGPGAPAREGFDESAADRENLDLARRHRDAIVRMLPAMIWYGHVSPDLARYELAYISDYLFTATGYTQEEWIGTPGFWRRIVHPDDLEPVLAATAQMMRGERQQGPPYRLRARDGRYLWVQSSMYVERDDAGEPVRMYGVTLDITLFIEARERSAELQREVADKARRLLELSAPIIPLGADVLILPLIGTLDPTRAEYALEALIHAVQRTHARRVIIDLTGVASVDAQSLAGLLHAAKAVRLLGARTMLTGIRPEVALAVLELGLSLDALRSYPSLADALRAP